MQCFKTSLLPCFPAVCVCFVCAGERTVTGCVRAVLKDSGDARQRLLYLVPTPSGALGSCRDYIISAR